ncbi:hypothetical protein PENANT_c011G00683 [Penicillium antarcticum]|uniref:F-box domain-containing protein n=1 Tax=Penicillium antarcticum TaxID=416450 RepID=A0A1V6Q764_9EURO|nr:hypothetical protein PENANT_c011G00683 [Penicillium antarcticum]
MSQPATIQILPTEILHLIAKNLDVFSLINLQHSCQRFCESIPSPTHKQLIEAEKSGLGFQKEFYACRDCLRLRPRAKFADTMIKRKKAKWGPGATDRCDDVVPPSPTWSEEFMDLVQAEADSYMNSPGPGSD